MYDEKTGGLTPVYEEQSNQRAVAALLTPIIRSGTYSKVPTVHTSGTPPCPLLHVLL